MRSMSSERTGLLEHPMHMLGQVLQDHYLMALNWSATDVAIVCVCV